MRKIRNFFLVLWLLVFGIIQSGCFASFPLTSSIWRWNSGMDGKWLNLLVFYGFVIIPVYELSLLADIVVFNSIEFWTGKNPISMRIGEEESQVVLSGDKLYKITSRKNQFEIEQLKGPEKGEKIWLNFHPEKKAWYLKTKGICILLTQYEDSDSGLVDQISVCSPSGEKIQLNAYLQNKQEVRALVEKRLKLKKVY